MNVIYKEDTVTLYLAKNGVTLLQAIYLKQRIKIKKKLKKYLNNQRILVESTKLGNLNLLEVSRYVHEGLEPLIVKGIGISGNALINVDVLSNIEKAMLERNIKNCT